MYGTAHLFRCAMYRLVFGEDYASQRLGNTELIDICCLFLDIVYKPPKGADGPLTFLERIALCMDIATRKHKKYGMNDKQLSALTWRLMKRLLDSWDRFALVKFLDLREVTLWCFSLKEGTWRRCEGEYASNGEGQSIFVDGKLQKWTQSNGMPEILICDFHDLDRCI